MNSHAVRQGALWEDLRQDGCETAGLLADFQLLLEGCIWLEHVRNKQLDPLWARLCHISGDGKGKPDTAATEPSVGQHPARVVRLWAEKREAWAARFDAQLVSVTKQAITSAGQLLATARSVPRLPDSTSLDGFLRSALVVRTEAAEVSHSALACFEPAFCAELREQTLQVMSALKNLRTSADSQFRKLNRALQLLAVASQGEASVSATDGGAHSFPEVSMTDKLSQTALGLILTMVMPVPGTVELGVVSIGALWLQGDSAGKHLVVEHSRTPDFDPLGRFQQQPRPSVRKLKGYLGMCVLFFNVLGVLICNKNAKIQIFARVPSSVKEAHCQLDTGHCSRCRCRLQ